MAEGARRAGATVISQVRYQFGQNSPPGCTAIVMLDESHCSVHTYADFGLVAMDVFTCGSTNPQEIWEYVRSELGLGDAQLRHLPRFETTVPSDLDTPSREGYRTAGRQGPQEGVSHV